MKTKARKADPDVDLRRFFHTDEKNVSLQDDLVLAARPAAASGKCLSRENAYRNKQGEPPCGPVRARPAERLTLFHQCPAGAYVTAGPDAYYFTSSIRRTDSKPPARIR